MRFKKWLELKKHIVYSTNCYIEHGYLFVSKIRFILLFIEYMFFIILNKKDYNHE